MTPRAKFVATMQYHLTEPVNAKRLAEVVWNTMIQAQNHDPEHAKELRDLRCRVAILERQAERLGAPQYRTVYKGKLPSTKRTK